jgi:prepilin-type processing-associated H-X9-DG protein
VSYLPDDDNPYSADASPGQPLQTSGKAIASLVLGILSIVLCCNVFTGIPAIIFGALGLGDVKNGQGRIKGQGMAIAGMVTGGIGSTITLLGILIALLLPAVQAARQAGRRNVSMHNMKQIGLGIHGYHGAHNKLPAAATEDDAGNPLLSWRVTILPFIEEVTLAKEFVKDEPWNGPTNKALVTKEPAIYTSPQRDPSDVGETNVLGIVGEDTVLTPEGEIGLRDVTDGMSRTIIAVELADSGIAWSEPRDITIDEFIAAMQREPKDAGLRPLYPGGAICLFADGSVRFIPTGTAPEILRALCTRAGGEKVAVPEF